MQVVSLMRPRHRTRPTLRRYDGVAQSDALSMPGDLLYLRTAIRNEPVVLVPQIWWRKTKTFSHN